MPHNTSRPYSCASCFASFARPGHLSSHVQQAAQCRWILQKRENAESAEMQDYRELSDLEDDPPADLEAEMSVDPFDASADGFPEIFENHRLSEEPEPPQVPPSPTTSNQNDRRASVEDASDKDADDEFHQNNTRSQIEDNLDHEEVFYKEFPNAGRILRADGQSHAAYSAAQYSNRPFYPFSSQMDWEIACWANGDGPGQTAFSKLLNINGVGG